MVSTELLFYDTRVQLQHHEDVSESTKEVPRVFLPFHVHPCPELVRAIGRFRVVEPFSHDLDPSRFSCAKLAAVSVCRNGVSDRVTVIHKSSAALKPGIDLPERGVDVVVTELVDSGLLGERIVAVLTDARARGLLAKGGRVIPEVFIYHMCL